MTRSYSLLKNIFYLQKSDSEWIFNESWMNQSPQQEHMFSFKYSDFVVEMFFFFPVTDS